VTTDHENSLAAFRAIVRGGRISEAKLRVAHALWLHPGGLTRNEIDRHLDPGAINSRYSRRLVELERAGICVRRGSRSCSVSGNSCDVWAYAPHEPEVLAPVARMPSPLEAAQLLEHLVTQIVPWDMIPQTRVLRAWLAAGAPRCARARAIPPGHAKPKAAPVEAPK
jgi:hypothetical protein